MENTEKPFQAIITSGDLAVAIQSAQKETLEGFNSMLGKAKQRISEVIVSLTRRGETAGTIGVENLLGIPTKMISEHLIPWLKDAGVTAQLYDDHRGGYYLQLKW